MTLGWSRERLAHKNVQYMNTECMLDARFPQAYFC